MCMLAQMKSCIVGLRIAGSYIEELVTKVMNKFVSFKGVIWYAYITNSTNPDRIVTMLNHVNIYSNRTVKLLSTNFHMSISTK